ncbi:MAG: DUF4189 domain-containing protein [Alphaproteobacteria bacterium]
MGCIRRSLAGAAVSGALACFAATAPADAAEPVGEFRVGNIWKGSARFASAGDFTRCGMTAGFPEGWELTFLLDAKGLLGLDMFGPDDMEVPKDKAPLTLSIDGRVLQTVAMEVDDEALMYEELWLFADLGPAGDYLPALKKGGSIMVVLQGETLGKPPQARAWSYTAALTGGAEAFRALEACVAKHAGSSRPAAAAPGGGATRGPTKGSTGTTKKAAGFGAIAVGEDGDDLISGISSDHPSLDIAMMKAVEVCQSEGGSCQVRATMDRATPCGALAAGEDSGGGPVYGWGTGTMQAEAELGAMQACSADAFGCRVTLSRCLKE